MIRLEMKNYNTVLAENLSKYLLYHQEKLVSMNILQVKKYYHLIKNKWYKKLSKAFEKQLKTIEDQGGKQIKAIQNQGQVKTIKKCDYDDEDSK